MNFIFGLLIISMILTGCNKDNNQTNLDYDTTIKNDKTIFNQEVTQPKEEKVVESEKKTTIDKNTPTKSTISYDTISNKKFGWGLKRNSEHITPEIPKATAELFKKNNTIYVGDTTKKVVYLTFDEGYENGYTGKILDTLKANNVKATFFITGPYIKGQTELIQRMIDEGHIIGNHTINHPSMPDLTYEKLEQELIGLDRLFYEKWHKNLKFMRPPKGEYSERTLAQLKDLGYTTVMWSFGYDDYDINNQKGTDYAYKTIMNNIHNGEIMLLHAVSKDNTEVLDKVIKDIKAQGYEFENLDSIK